MKEKIKRRKQFEDFVNSKEAEVEHLKRQVSAGRMHMCDLQNILDEEANKLHSFFERDKKYLEELQAHVDHLTK
jgi:DNA repair exonuclease SbcCD ATPase subunit